MSPGRPEAIDSRLVFHVYACVAIPAGLDPVYMWPALTEIDRSAALWFAPIRIAAAVVTSFGCCAAAFAAIEEPLARRRGLLGLAHAHILLGAMLLLQWVAVPSPALPVYVGWGPLITGLVLLYLAITGEGADFSSALPGVAARSGAPRGAPVRRPKQAGNRSPAVGGRTADQTGGETGGARATRARSSRCGQAAALCDSDGRRDRAGALRHGRGRRQGRPDQVRVASREAMAEMEAMLDQLQGPPIENAGLVAFLKKQGEALGFRTGADVAFELGTLPDQGALDPGARQAISRVAQEALSNVARHARARHVAVSLGAVDGRLVLTVKDDGSGFVTEGKRRGMGMGNIAARAAEVGGTVDVVSVPGGGTTVRFSVPYRTCRRRGLYRPPSGRMGEPARDRGRRHAVARRQCGPWTATIALIAGIAVARYTVARPGSGAGAVGMTHHHRARRRSPGRDAQPQGLSRVVRGSESGWHRGDGRGTGRLALTSGSRTSCFRIC